MRRIFFLFAATFLAGLSPLHAETLPLPDGVVAFDSPAGEALFLGAEARQDYFQLSMHFVTQDNPAFCGPASMAMVLNAIGAPRPASKMTLGLGLFDQTNVFTPATEAVKPSADILKAGMTLDEFGGMLKAHDLTVEVRHAGETSLDDFRKVAAQTLEDGDRFIVVNYLRKAIGQEAGGHISPLGAYDEDTDRFLILDVTRYKYPPVWVGAAALYDAMNTPDSDNGGKTRGYVVVGR
ncbi:Phytochelatin synthase [Hartmannibacter diazotrophicus]|uniref:glutathione gamma-glutamylcysteinyltransferase n=1 Tax=Hartmannibacter diazotrophicus TaxID=1482074 RepID=A0A2C9DA87_9HYPH|nr:phytochelatin synthase family protein [Hartmannibacter diazotrophicus]SON57176.1 Phytochelatin synthase [Hartmannibacter diazotrophicus]